MSETPPNFDPKAQAAADKAYAKAQRPWFKKKRFIIPLVIVALIVIGSAASSGGSTGGQKDQASDTPTAQVTNSQKETPAATKAAKAATVADNSSKGKGAITWGNWQVEGRLQVSKEDYTNDFAVVTRVRNTGKSPDEGLFTVTILKGQEVLGTADCFTSTVQPGAVATAKCSSMDKFQPGYTEVTIEDAY